MTRLGRNTVSANNVTRRKIDKRAPHPNVGKVQNFRTRYGPGLECSAGLNFSEGALKRNQARSQDDKPLKAAIWRLYERDAEFSAYFD